MEEGSGSLASNHQEGGRGWEHTFPSLILQLRWATLLCWVMGGPYFMRWLTPRPSDALHADDVIHISAASEGAVLPD